MQETRTDAPMAVATSRVADRHVAARSSRILSAGFKSLIFATLFTSAITSPLLEDGADAPVPVALSPPTLDEPGQSTDPAPAPTSTVDAREQAAQSTSVTSPPIQLAPAVRLDQLEARALSDEYVSNDVGCAADLSAEGLAAFFGEQLGAIEGFDGPRLYPLGGGRTLWMLQDTFIDYADAATSFANMDYANSTALIQEGSCFTSLQRGTATSALAFELGVGEVTFDRYFWPAGGTVTGDTLMMFWMEMVRDPEIGGPLDGISLHPASTWLATYDSTTMQRLDFRPAPNPGVSPVYGYTVVDDGAWTYLFGNSYLQNLALEGGYGNGPHSATRNYLARVPRGQLGSEPMYWDGRSWSPDEADAEPISSRFWAENSMLPVLIDDRWVSATKVDGFTGSGVTVDVADEPWGPYRTVALLPATPRITTEDIVTYHAMVLPWLDPSGDLIVSLSQIPLALGADDAPPKYRPNFVAVEIPE